MASHTLQPDLSQAIGYTGQLSRPAAAARLLSQFDRDQLEGFIAVAIDVLDAIEGDTDVELNGDEREFDGDERDFSVAGWMPGRHGTDVEDAEEDDAAEEDDHSGDSLDQGEGTYGLDC